MTDEQKQRATELVSEWNTHYPEYVGDRMAALLQELIDTPEPKPVLVVKVEPDYWHRGHYCEGPKPYINPLEVWKLPVGTKLYTAPPANNQSEQQLEMVNAPAPSVPDGQLQAAFDRGFKAGNEQGIAQQIEIHKLHDLLAAPTPAEPPADLVRDAERWLSEHDLELLVTFGMQADDCDADGHTLSKEQTRRLCELGVLRNVGFGRHEMTAFGDSIFGVHFSQGISLPLQTHAEYNAAIERNKQKGGEA